MSQVDPRSLIEQVHQTGRADCLRKAEALPGLRGEALLVNALQALGKQQTQRAMLPLIRAAAIFNDRPEVQVLLVQTLFQASHNDIAHRVLEDRLIQFPTDARLLQLQGASHTATSDVAALAAASAETNGDFEPPFPSSAPRESKVDVLIPVYKGFEETLACINSVLQYRDSNQTPHELIVLDDASPDPALQNKLEQLSAARRITYIRRPANLGFIGNMNRGMALHPGRDVVWLNADTRVHGNWLDRLNRAAYSNERVASVTPFSNNGLVMSVPEPLDKAPMPTDAEYTTLDQLAALLNQPPVEIPSGCGFCFYLRRDAINDVGYLDEVHLKRGYEEETDWCQRARKQGWKHLGATNVFVAHRGGVSFGPEKALRVLQNGRILRRRYPTFKGRWQRFLAQDPLKAARTRLLQSVDACRPAPAAPAPHQTLSLQAFLTNPTPSVWLIGDDLAEAGAAPRWLKLARLVARRGLACTFILPEPTPHEVELARTGVVCLLPKTRGVTPDEALRLSGVQGCLSLHTPDLNTSTRALRNAIPTLRLQ